MARRNLRPARLVALVALALLLTGAVPAGTRASSPPKVAIIVGPAGTAATERYRRAAAAAAKVAETLTPEVVRVVSPDATWPAVRAAVDGASVVVYLGHGNGWPSRYATALQPKTMDGFGLNPAAGGDDVAHQYFGEAYVAGLRLAPGAVVILSHLCYASGSSEPGLADGTFSDVYSRVDNFAAPFLAAGAAAVIAEGHQNPDALMAAAVQGPAAAVQAWQNAAWGHGHQRSYPSLRTPGAAVTLDPDRVDAGFYRSLVQAPGHATGTRPSGSLAPIGAVAPAPPSLASAGAAFGPASLDAAVVPGAPSSLRVPITRAAAALPRSLLVGVRWLPLLAAATDGATTDDGMIVGEASGDVVETAAATRTGDGLALRVPVPAAPGTYIVILTLETADGTAYDGATQALLRPFTVEVPRPIDLRMSGPSAIRASPATPVAFDVTLENAGTQAWGSPLYASMWSDPSLDPGLAGSFSSVLRLDAVWLNTATGAATAAASYPLPRQLGSPGAATTVHMAVQSPAEPGAYLLVLSLGVQGSLGEFPRTPLVVPAAVDGPTPPASASPPAPSASPSAAPSIPGPRAGGAPRS